MQSVFSYPPNDEDSYLSWYKDDFSSVFVAANPFLNLPQFATNPHDDGLPNEVASTAKQLGADVGVTWKRISDLCGFPSIAHVNRALRLTGSKRISDELSSPSDTSNLLKVCREQNFFLPEEGFLSPLCELSLARFLKKLGHDEVIVADHFGSSPRSMKSNKFSQPELIWQPEIQARDRSTFVSIYPDYHYFLICQTVASRQKANPADFFEGFSADKNTNDFWGIGNLD